MLYLSGVIDELRWESRLDEANRLPYIFGPEVTSCIDTFPIYVQRPRDAVQQRMLYNRKYGSHVVKVAIF